YGIDLPSWDAMGSPFKYLSGGPYKDRNDIIVDDFYANSAHKKVGDTMTVLNHDFRIAGVVAHGKGGRKFLQIGTLQELTGSEGKASIFYVKLDDPNHYGLFRDEVAK